MGYYLKPKNDNVEPFKMRNGDFHEILNLTGMDHLCRDRVTAKEAARMADCLFWIQEFIVFANKSGGFRIE